MFVSTIMVDYSKNFSFSSAYKRNSCCYVGASLFNTLPVITQMCTSLNKFLKFVKLQILSYVIALPFSYAFMFMIPLFHSPFLMTFVFHHVADVMYFVFLCRMIC